MKGFGRFLADRRGATAAVMALLLVPIVAAIGMGVEGGGWYLVHRAAQNAADSASIAAAINACAPGDACDVTAKSATYVEEAAVVASQFGFTDDADTDIATTKVNCPGGATPDCYQVMITKRMPLSLVRMAGFGGDATVSGQPAQTISAVAIARPAQNTAEFPCMLGLGTTGNPITLSGMGSVTEGAGCDLRSNAGIKCNGANATNFPDHAASANGSNDCAAPEDRKTDLGVMSPPDPFSAAQGAIPANTCTTYSARTLNSSYTGGTRTMCGNTTLTSDVNVTTANSVLVVRQGYLDLGDHELKTSGNGSLTIILTGFAVGGGPANTVNHRIQATSGGAVDKLTIRAPSSNGALSNIAVMQYVPSPGTRNDLAMDFSGIQPQLNLQGVIYQPQGTISVSGAINFFSPDVHCIVIAALSINISGNGALANGAADDCLPKLGLALPTIPGASTRQALVQ